MTTDPRSAPDSEPPPQRKARHARLSGLWLAITFFAVVLVLLLIFILQNSAAVKITYFGAHGRLSLGVALLLSAISGALLVILASVTRVSRVRAAARLHRRADARRAAAAGAPADPGR